MEGRILPKGARENVLGTQHRVPAGCTHSGALTKPRISCVVGHRSLAHALPCAYRRCGQNRTRTWRGQRMRVLVVEDERVLADAIATGLRREAMAVDVAYDGGGALERTAYIDYDVIVLDRDLPVVHGDEVCRRLVAQRSATRIIMLTASGDTDDKVEGLGLGADDYLAKPFVFIELVARVRALGRRSAPALPPVLERGGIRLDPGKRLVERLGREIILTKKEFAVLEELMRAEGAVVSQEDLLDKAWGENIDPFTNVVRVTMMTLRKKLGEPQVIETVPGVGYKL